MCGRFAVTTPPEAMRQLFGTSNLLPNTPPRTNIAPTDSIMAIRFDATHKQRSLDLLRWGLVPHWAKQTAGPPLINARAESLAERPAFRQAFEKRRCLIPADAFYEWQAGSKPKQPFAIRASDGAMMAFAGIWENWRQPDGSWLRSCAIVTTTANAALAVLHDRMPVILDPADWPAWLGETGAAADALRPLLRPCPSDALELYRVSRAVNKVGSEGPALLAPEAVY
jgi:putative SOS response-associated peptidase YedK